MPFDPEALPVPDLGLRCLRCGYNLAGLAEHRCPECGRSFTMEEHIPEGDYPTVIFNGREVESSAPVVALLKRMRIPYMEVMRPGDVVYGIGGATHKTPKIAVPRSSFFEAIDLLRRLAFDEAMPEAEADVPAGSAWNCARCRESNPGNFELCWNCGTARPL